MFGVRTYCNKCGSNLYSSLFHKFRSLHGQRFLMHQCCIKNENCAMFNSPPSPAKKKSSKSEIYWPGRYYRKYENMTLELIADMLLLSNINYFI